MTLEPVSLARAYLLKELNLSGVPEEEQNQILKKIEDTLSTAVSLAIIEVLSEEERAEFVERLETQPDYEILTWLGQVIPNLNDIINREVKAVLAQVKA